MNESAEGPQLSPRSDAASSAQLAALRWMQAVVLAPLVLVGLLCVFDDSFRAALSSPLTLLARGDLDGIRDWAALWGAWSPLATLALMVAQAIVAPIPAVLVTATNSLLFGPFWGGVHSILSANLAATLCYVIGRCLSPAVVRLVSPGVLERTRAFVDRHGVAAVLTSRLLPFVPFDPISYVAGMARMRPGPFFWATLIGQTPAAMAYSYLFQEVHHPLRFVVVAASTFLGLCVVGWSVRHIVVRRGRVLPP